MDEGADTNTRASGGEPSASESSRLCHACLSVFTRREVRGNTFYPHHDSLKSFIDASSKKCYICSWMLSVAPESFQEGLTALAEKRISDNMIAADSSNGSASDERAMLLLGRSLETSRRWAKCSFVSFTVMEVHYSATPSAVELQIKVYQNPLYKGYFPFNTRAYDGWLRHFWEDLEQHIVFPWQEAVVLVKPEVLTGLKIAKTLPSNTGSLETWSTVKKWIQHCSEHHRCMAEINKNYYPTRLVERLPNERFRVIRSDSRNFQRGSGYITLSHRWGDSDFLKLTTGNLTTLEEGLPVARLRKIFQDALIITQWMRMSYIWIDSLCIIQSGDDQADWREESKTMEQVYSNSFCNISADWGDDSNGLFFERACHSKESYGPQLEIPLDLAKSHRESNSSAWFRRGLRPKPALSRWHPLLLPDLLEDVTRSPLNHRGWVLQERLLAPRVVHFSPKQVTWQCAESHAWEKAPFCLDELRQNSEDLENNSRIMQEHSKVKVSMRRLNVSHGSGALLGYHWGTVVEKYTKSDLTKPSDKLIAFAGIARKLAPLVGQYVAGLWAKSMPVALLWEVRPRGPRTKQSRCEVPGHYYAPTFSWAAVHGEVRVVYDRGREEQLVASATFIKHRDKPFSSAATETLLTDNVFGPLHAPVVEVRVRGILRSCRVSEREDSCVCPALSAVDCAVDLGPTNRRDLKVLYDRVSDEHVSEDADSTVYYFTIISSLNVSIVGTRLYGLLLKSVDASMARFARVGLVHVTQDHLSTGADVRAPIGNERDLPAWNYDEATGEHTFYIV